MVMVGMVVITYPAGTSATVVFLRRDLAGDAAGEMVFFFVELLISTGFTDIPKHLLISCINSRRERMVFRDFDDKMAITNNNNNITRCLRRGAWRSPQTGSLTRHIY